MKKHDLRQSRQIGGLKTQIKHLHARLKVNDMHVNIALILIIIIGLAVIARGI